MQPSRPILLILAAMFAFGMMALFTRAADASVLTVAAWRALLVAAVFGGWAFSREGGAAALRPDRETLRLAVPYGLALAVASTTFVGGYAMTTVANTIFLHNLAPAVAFPLAWWMFRERPGPGTVAGAGVAILGVAMLSGVSLFHFAHFTNPRFLLGDLLALASAVGYAGVLVLTRATRQADTPLLGTLFFAWSTAAVLTVGVALLFDTMWISGEALLWVAGLAVLCTNLPFYLLNQGMKHVNAGTASLLSMTEVLFATALGVLVYSEQLAPIGWLGGAVVALGVLYPFFAPQPASEDEAAAVSLPFSAEGAAPRRWGRLGLGLLLLNAGAALALLRGNGAGALLAWIGGAQLLRLGPPALLHLLDGSYASAQRWGLGVLSALLAVGVALRGGWAEGEPGLLAAAVALVALLIDSGLARAEAEAAEPEADRSVSIRGALGLLAASQLAGLAAHPAAVWLLAASAALAVLAVWPIIAGALAGGGRWWSGRRGAEAVVQRAGRPSVLGAVALALWWLGGVSQVPPGHQAVVERFGEPLAAPRGSGLLVRLPPPIEEITLIDVASVRRAALAGEETLLCGDQSMVTVSATLHYTVSDARRYAYAAVDAEQALLAEARAALTSVIGRLPQDAVLTDRRGEVEAAVLELTRARAAATGLGLSPEGLQLTGVSVPPPVMDAFLDVISADEERRTRINRAEAYAAAVIPEALGEAAAINQRAEGEAVALLADAESWAAHHAALSAGGAGAAALTRHRLRQEELSETMAGRRLILAPPSVKIWLGGAGLPPVSPAPAASGVGGGGGAPR